jgi:hypothetical protein
MTFVHQTETQETEQIQTIVESAVSNDMVKERTAIRLVSYLAKLNKLSPSFALSIFGSVARSGEDQKLRSEAFDAIENLMEQSSFNFANFDKYDQLEVFCLQAALTPAQYWRQINLHRIEQYSLDRSTDKILKYEAATKLLSLSQDSSSPQACIDILLSVPIRLNNPDITERAIPILCKAVKERSGNASRKDVTDYLESLAKQVGPADRDGLRSRIRLYLASALVTKDQTVHDGSLQEIAQICSVNPDLQDDTEQLFDEVSRNMADTDLRSIVDTVHSYLGLLKEKLAERVTQKS